MTSAAQRHADEQWPNHTYARGKFLEGVRWHAEQPVTITTAQRDRAVSEARRFVERGQTKGLELEGLWLGAVATYLAEVGIKVRDES